VSCKSGHRFCGRFNSATAGAGSPHGERVALGKFGGEFAQVTQTYVGQLQSGLCLRAYFAYTASDIRLWHKADPPSCTAHVRFCKRTSLMTREMFANDVKRTIVDRIFSISAN
jgi:hypothetical protein